MKKKPRIITVTSSLIEISTDQYGGDGEGLLLLRPSPFFSIAGFWTDISRRREQFFFNPGYLLHAEKRRSGKAWVKKEVTNYSK